MAMIPSKDVEAILAQTDIVDVVSRYVPLQKKGREYVGLCPFHPDHDPSMRVSPEKQIFKCFVCGTGGNTFTFLQKIEKISFPEAVMLQARELGYPLSVSEASFEKPKLKEQPLYDAMDAFLTYCSMTLFSPDGQAALDYLHERKFSDDLIRDFQIGFAPASFRSQAFFRTKEGKISQEDLEKTGLVKEGRVFFHDRIVIPIRDGRGHPIGITARCLPADQKDQPKYLNTSATELYNKGSVLFNYDRAAKAARKSGRVIIVEGAMDVLGLEKAGISEGVAALGTALTDEQMELLRRLQVPITVLYDADRAGQDAVWKFGQKALEAHVPFSVARPVSGKDPDEVFITSGKEGVENLLGRTQSFVDFTFDYLKKDYNLDNYSDRQEYSSRLSALIFQSLPAIEQTAALEKLRSITGMDYSMQIQEWRSQEKRERNQSKRGPMIVEGPQSGRLQAEKGVLWAMLISYANVEKFKSRVGFFKDPDCQSLSLYIYDAYRKSDHIDFQMLLNALPDDNLRSLLIDITELPLYVKDCDDLLEDMIRRIERSSVEISVNKINAKMSDALSDEEKLDLLMKKRDLIAKKHQLGEEIAPASKQPVSEPAVDWNGTPDETISAPNQD